MLGICRGPQSALRCTPRISIDVNTYCSHVSKGRIWPLDIKLNNSLGWTPESHRSVERDELLTMKGKFFCGNVNTDGLRWPRDAKYGLCPLLFKFTNIYDLQMCFQEYTWFFKQAGDGSSEVLIFCLLYAFKCSEIKNSKPQHS